MIHNTSILSLSQFFVDQFPNFWWYPNWYLGNPFNYLIGPVVPVILGISNFQFLISNQISMLQIYLGLIFISIIASATGLYFLTQQLGSSKKQSLLSGIFLSLLLSIFYLLLSSNGLYQIAWGMLPWVFLIFHQFLQKPSKKHSLFLITTISFLLLIDTLIFLPLLIGFVSLAVTLARGRLARLEYPLKKLLLIIFASLSIITIWYTPGYWFTLLQNPSFGGMPLFNLIKFLYQLLLHLLPLIAAVAVVKFQKIKLSPAIYFSILFTSSFLFLTLLRFLSDPDFVSDWLGFLIELGFGFSIILGLVATHPGGEEIGITPPRWNSSIKNLLPAAVVILITLFISVNLKSSIINQSTSAYQSRITTTLKNNIKDNERVFLSGSPVFFMGINQVRGGVDQAAYHPFWAHGAYQVREGDSPKLSSDWLKAFGAQYVLVHGSSSKDPYHDFKNFDKFFDDKYFTRIEGIKGDILYQVIDSSIARAADESLLKVKKPKDGADKDTLAKYVNTFKTPANLTKFDLARLIVVGADLKEDEMIALAITYHPDWKIIQGQGEIKSDSLGNMVIIPKKVGDQQFSLEFQPKAWEWLVPGFISLVLLFLIYRYDKPLNT